MKTLLKFHLCIFLSLLTTQSFSQAGMWTWISGINQIGAVGVYGVQGVPSVNNYPPGLYEYAEWKDLQGNFWVYGGWDPGFSDLWRFNPSTLEWTWMKGNGSTGQQPVYGTLGVSSPANTPGERTYCSVTWVDLLGNLWLFGGAYARNDLWKYDITTNEWTWMSGSDVQNQLGVYGTLGVPSPLNVPGARIETCSAWADAQNNLWMFGGMNSGVGTFNDLWRYSITTNEWTWMKGSNFPNAASTYGTKGIPNATNCPGSRITYSKWKDIDGNFWLMGGSDAGYREDVWKYDPASNQWTWMAGTDLAYQAGVYQTTCVSDTSNRPSGRVEHRSTVTDNCGRFWLFGGLNSNSFGNDLWVFNPINAQWMWVYGVDFPSQTNIYGTKGVAAATNRPASRWGSVSWWGDDNRFYLYGGNDNNVGPNFCELWVYTPDSNCLPPCGILPVAALAAPNHICPGSCINFMSLSQNAISYQWIFTGASISVSTDENPQSVCYNTPGTYDVTLIAYNANGSDTMSLPGYITVFPSPPPQGILQSGDTLFANQGAVSYQWYLNNVIINGATDYYYLATQSGNYNVVCTDSNNCEVEAVLNDVIASINYLSIGEESPLKIYPNPASNELIVETENLKIDNIAILTITGRKVLQIENDISTIDISSLADGYYFIEAKSDNKIYRSSFVKKSD